MTQASVSSLAGMTRAELLKLPTVVDLETAARALGIGRTNAYQLARRDQFPCAVIRAGRIYRVPTAGLLRALQVVETEPAIAPVAA